MAYKLAILFLVIACFPSLAAISSTADEIRLEKLKVGAKEGLAPDILELGRTGDTALVPFLKDLLMRSRKDVLSPRRELRMALAKLGDKAALQDITHRLRDPNATKQHFAVEDLTYVANKDAIRELAGVLDNEMDRRSKDVLFRPLCYEAVSALDQIVTDPPVRLPTHPMPDGTRQIKELPTQQDVLAWRAWWKKNKDSYR
jgi:HEAT repeat protein